MSKPVRVTDPVTGAVAYTKRPDRLIRRRGAERHASGLILPRGFEQRLADAEAELEFKRNRGERVYWNGAMGHDKSYPPGCDVHFRRPGQRRSA